MPNPIVNRRVVLKSLGLLPETKLFINAANLAGVPVTTPYIVRYNNAINYLIKSGEWNNLDSLFFDFTGDKAWALIDVRNPSRTATKVNTYAGEFTANYGWNGNHSFSLLTNYNPTGSAKFTQNNCSVGGFFLNNVTATIRHQISAFDAGYTQGIFINENIPQVTSLNANTIPVPTYNKYRFTNSCWIGINRTDANTQNLYYNGVLSNTYTNASVAINNIAIGRLNAYNGTWAAAATYGSDNSQGCFYAGNGYVNLNNIITAANIFLTGIASSCFAGNRVIFEGDSMTGSIPNASLSVNSTYVKTTMTTLGNGWTGAIVSEVNETVQSMVSQASTEIDPYRNVYLQKDVIVIFAGTNDIANGRTGTQTYNDMVTWATDRKAKGFKVVIVGIPDRRAGLSVSQATFDSERLSYRTSMNLDFNVSTGISNVFSPKTGITYADYWIDISADSRFNNASDLTYFMADSIHINSTAAILLANTYVAPTIQFL